MNDATMMYLIIDNTNLSVLDRVKEGVFDYPIQTDYLEPFLNSLTHHLLVAINEAHEVVGFVTFTDLFHPDKATQVFVNELSVHEDYQRRGIGTTLMNHVFRYAKEHAYYVWVATEMENEAADTFYQTLNPDSRQNSYFYDWKIKKDRS